MEPRYNWGFIFVVILSLILFICLASTVYGAFEYWNL